MTFSVVLIVYNQLALTRACLESLRGTSEPFELCVVDNASTDGTEEFLRTAAPPLARPPPPPLPSQRGQRRAHPRAQPGRGAGRRRRALLPAQRHRDARRPLARTAAGGARGAGGRGGRRG